MPQHRGIFTTSVGIDRARAPRPIAQRNRCLELRYGNRLRVTEGWWECRSITTQAAAPMGIDSSPVAYETTVQTPETARKWGGRLRFAERWESVDFKFAING